MVIVASIYLRFYIKVGVRASAFLLTLTAPKIPSDSDSTALAGSGFLWYTFITLNHH
jgi:hypothetical protein